MNSTHTHHSNRTFDVAIIGAGIVGLANAWMAARAGLSVVVFERDTRTGASIRNFGMVWPIGLSNTLLYHTALRSRELWLEISAAAGIWCSPCGSMHAARAEDEWQVVREFAEYAAQNDIAAAAQSPGDVLARFPGARSTGLLGGLFSPTELAIDSRQAVAHIPDYLAAEHGVRFHFNTAVTQIESDRLITSTGDVYSFSRAVVCSNVDFNTLFPETFVDAGLRRCKLQMLRTVPQPRGFRVGGHVAGGLTLRHYSNFSVCPGIHALRSRIAAENPLWDKLGIHVMASQNELGEVVIGDSHEYDADISPFDKAEIDDLILAEIAAMLDLPDPTIAARWHGLYTKHPRLPEYRVSPMENVEICLNTNGLGMTLSFGLAEAAWKESVLVGGR